jgi:predicted aconitase
LTFPFHGGLHAFDWPVWINTREEIMKRRDFLKGAAAVPVVGAVVPAISVKKAIAEEAPTELKVAQATKVNPAAKPSVGGSAKAPDWAEHFITSDMDGTGPDGKPNGQTATFTGASKAEASPDSASSKMELTADEQEILDGRDGPEKAKLMKILVVFGETFGATKLVELGGAPHSNLYIGAAYLESLIDMLSECADAGLKSYATYTVNPRPYDVYNVQNNPTDMELIYEGYPLQMKLDYVHSKLGAPDLNFRSCACYLKEIGNAPEPGTNVAWCESSAVNYGNSVLGIRTNRYGAGMEMVCALLGKAPVFGLMTDEGRKAKWLVDVKTTGEPDWGALGTAIGRKVVEDIPYIAGVDQYFGGEVTPENMHKLKSMGSATAAAGAVGCYHVEGVTPEPKDKGRDMLAEGFQTYVFDDAEQKATVDTFENLWTEPDGDPNAAFIGCPHNTYQEVVNWCKMVTDALDAAGQEKTAIPVYMFMANVVRTRLLEEETELAGKAKRAGMFYTNMCAVSYSGMKGFSDRIRGVTNSAKTRNYSTIRYFPDAKLVDIIVTGKA